MEEHHKYENIELKIKFSNKVDMFPLGKRIFIFFYHKLLFLFVCYFFIQRRE